MKKLKGFTLIEILLATGILVMVGVAAIGIERNFMGSATTNKHKLQANALAQEGINAIKAFYNTNLLNDSCSYTDKMKIIGGACTSVSATPNPSTTYYIDNASGNLTPTVQTTSLNGVTFTRTIVFPTPAP